MEPKNTEVEITGADKVNNIYIKRKTVPPFPVHRSNPEAAVHLWALSSPLLQRLKISFLCSPSINIKFSVIFKTMCLFKSQNVYTDFWWSLNDPSHSIQIFYFDMFVNSKASITLENDLRRYGSFHIQNSTAQQQVRNHHKSFHFSC